MEKLVFNALILKVLIGQTDVSPNLAAQLRKFPLLQASKLAVLYHMQPYRFNSL